MPKITDLTADTAPDPADVVPFVDVSAGATEKVTVDNLAASSAFSGRYVAVPTTWTAVSGGVGFQNSWVNYGSGLPDAAYRKVGDVVQVRGLVKSGTIAATIFTLPVGFRPPNIHRFSTVSNDAYGSGEVNASGDITIWVGSNTWVSLDVISFSVTA